LASCEEEAQATIYLVGHGWHTGLVLPTQKIEYADFPEAEDYWQSDYMEIGWGDEGFYRAKKITPSIVAKAALWPTASVMHISSFEGSVREFFPVSDIHEIRLTDEEFVDLSRFISGSFERDENGKAVDLGPGLYGVSRFLRARGKYYMPKTCNVWTAKALREAGLPVIPQTAVFAENLLGQSRRFSRVLQESPQGLKQAMLESPVSE
jgi:uncharacterized protein (TIGR02117 family)